jgi:hypothetical protein
MSIVIACGTCGRRSKGKDARAPLAARAWCREPDGINWESMAPRTARGCARCCGRGIGCCYGPRQKRPRRWPSGPLSEVPAEARRKCSIFGPYANASYAGPSQLDGCLKCETVPEPFCSCWAREFPRLRRDRAAVKVLNAPPQSTCLVRCLIVSRKRPTGRGSRAPGSNLSLHLQKNVQQTVQHFDQQVRLRGLQVL